jgi:hypothetical protein
MWSPKDLVVYLNKGSCDKMEVDGFGPFDEEY